MGLAFIIVAGVVAGWVASVVCNVHTTHGVVTQLVAGVLGALAGTIIISPLFVESGLSAGTYTVPALLLTLVGAALFVALLNLLRPGFLR